MKRYNEHRISVNMLRDVIIHPCDDSGEIIASHTTIDTRDISSVSPLIRLFLNRCLHLKLDGSMARRHLKSPQSLSGRSLHLNFQGHGQGQTWWSLRPSVHSIWVLFILWQSNHLWLRYSKFQIWPHSQGDGPSKIPWSHLRLRVQSICLPFVSW